MLPWQFRVKNDVEHVKIRRLSKERMHPENKSRNAPLPTKSTRPSCKSHDTCNYHAIAMKLNQARDYVL
ncbi:MAG: hypothetical protein ACTSU9_15470 [Promethearchaeota archaeon]